MTGRTTEAPFTEAEVVRYARHIVLPGIGAEGQSRLREGSALVVGAGGLGSPAAMYLAAAGVGTLGIADGDSVDLSNLQRQIIHDTDHVGRAKAASASARISALNPEIQVVSHDTDVASADAMDLVASYDVVIDGTDRFSSRYLLNDATQLAGKPLVYGSIHRFEGQASVFLPGKGSPCYRCLFPTPPEPGSVPSCAEAGVFGALPGVVGSIQAIEAIKLLTGTGEPLAGRILMFDALTMEFRSARVAWDPGCAVCGDSPTVRELIDYETFCSQPTARSR